MARLSASFPEPPAFLPMLFTEAANPAAIQELSKRV
jgi:hypothetical protein